MPYFCAKKEYQINMINSVILGVFNMFRHMLVVFIIIMQQPMHGARTTLRLRVRIPRMTQLDFILHINNQFNFMGYIIQA